MAGNRLLGCLGVFVALLLLPGWVDPCVRAQRHLKWMEAFLAMHVGSTKVYPELLREAFSWDTVNDVSAVRDPWGKPYQYQALASGFHLYSLGPDGVANTDDDIFADGPLAACTRSRWENGGPCVVALEDIIRLEDEIRRFVGANHRQPRSLHELSTYMGGTDGTDSPSLVFDPWGERYLYSPYTCVGYRVESKGADRLRPTWDDIESDRGYAQCGMLWYDVVSAGKLEPWALSLVGLERNRVVRWGSR